MKKELEHYYIGSSYGGNQEWFSGFMMKTGGCAAETAIENCIYFDRNFNTSLCPFDANNVTKEDFISFGEIMKPYLRPRMSGIDRISIFIEGFKEYLNEKNSPLTLIGIEGTEEYETARAAVISHLDKGFPVSFLCLNHTLRSFKEYQWHWFLINGYELYGDTLMVKAVTYSMWEWIDFRELWNTGCLRRGGMVLCGIE